VETFLAILMVIGIYVVAPAIVGFGIAGLVVLRTRRSRRARPRESVEDVIAAMEEMIAAARPEEGSGRATRQPSRRPGDKSRAT